MKESITIYVKKFQNGLISRREFLKKINPLILKIPIYLGYKDIDIKHEFYAHVLSKIDKIISSYKIIPKANFTTWLNIVLKREFYYFISKINKIKEFESLQINEAISNYSIDNQGTLLLFNKTHIDFTPLTEKEKDVVSLKYGIKIYKRDISKSSNQILKKLDKKRNMEKTLTKKYYKIIKAKKYISISEENILINGYHRLKAFKTKYGKDYELKCYVHLTKNLDYIELESYSSNTKHGKKNSRDDNIRNISYTSILLVW